MTRNFYLLLSGFFISTVGDWFYQLALPLLIYNITHSPVTLAVTYGLTYLPYLFLLPLGGLIADRFDRRRLLVVGDCTSAIIVGILALLALLYSQAGWIIWAIYPLAFALASATPIYHPAFQSYLPRLVKDESLPQANSWMQSAENLVMILGPLVGGIVIALFSSTLALFIDMVSFFASALLLALIRAKSAPKVGEQGTSSWLEPLREGFRVVWRAPVLLYGSFLFLVTNFATTLIQANFIFFLVNTLKFNPSQIGLTFSLTGVGALGGALIAPKLLQRFQPGHILLTTTICSGLITAVLLVGHDVWSVAIPWGIVTALSTINVVTWFTLRQRVVPNNLLGRVIAITRLIAFFSIPVAAFVGGGLLASLQNMSIIIVVASLLRIVVGGLGFFSPLASRQANSSMVQVGSLDN